MTTLLVVSNDHWGALAEACAIEKPDVIVVADHSGGLARSLRLVGRGSIPVSAAVQMWLAQRTWPNTKPRTQMSFRSNPELRVLADQHDISRIVLFRAGLIISGKTIEQCEVLNIHCADINGFGGLASIHRALKVGAYAQKATLHRVTSRIDEGEVFDTEPYRLDPTVGYSRNEDLAYHAGLRLLDRVLGDTGSAGKPAR